jgi:hypothetical protein
MEQRVHAYPPSFPPPMPLQLVPQNDEDDEGQTQKRLVVIPQSEQVRSWQQMDQQQQNELVYCLLYGPLSKESEQEQYLTYDYVGDMNLLHDLLLWTHSEGREFHESRFNDALHYRVLARMGMPPEYGPSVPISSGLRNLEMSDVCYTLLEVYGPQRADLVVPRYSDQ